MSDLEKLPCKGECANPNIEPCGATSGDFICSRNEGHEGNHVACGYSKHGIKIWTNIDGFPLKIIKQVGENVEGIRGVKGPEIPDPYVKPEMFRYPTKPHSEELITLQDLHDKWIGRVNGWLVDSAWLLVGRDAGRADAALETLMEDKKK
jgi:hypothetical protein